MTADVVCYWYRVVHQYITRPHYVAVDSVVLDLTY